MLRCFHINATFVRNVHLYSKRTRIGTSSNNQQFFALKTYPLHTLFFNTTTTAYLAFALSSKCKHLLGIKVRNIVDVVCVKYPRKPFKARKAICECFQYKKSISNLQLGTHHIIPTEGIFLGNSNLNFTWTKLQQVATAGYTAFGIGDIDILWFTQ